LGQPLPADIWQKENLPPHLQMNFRLYNNEKQTIDMNRDLSGLQKKWGDHASDTCQQEIAQESGLERDNLTTWTFGQLPEKVALTVNGVAIQGFPTLVDEETHVALRVLDNQIVAQQKLREGLRRLFLLALPTKKLLKQMPIQHKLCLQYLKVGNCEQLKEDLLMALVDALFLGAPLPTSEGEFTQRLTNGKQRLMTVAYEYTVLLTEILTEYHGLTQRLTQLPKTNKILTEVKQHLQHLVYAGFVRDIPLAQLKHVPRYLKASSIRLERFAHDPQKDAKKAEQFKPLWEAYWQRRAEQETLSTEWLEFRWLLEELRVSLFAQELKTVCPVSVQKLRKMWEELIL
jgi:ATP-dependent helicase HrpA